jgi:lipopolysaccharide transport system permease protein
MKVRYKSTFFGYVWSIAHPLAFAFVFFRAFKIVMRIQMAGYTVFLIAGLFPWQWFSNSVNASAIVFLTNAALIKKVKLPRNILPLATVLQDMIHFLLSISVIVLFLFIYHRSPSFSWLYGIPLLLSPSVLVMTHNLLFSDIAENFDFNNPYHKALVELLIHHENILIANKILPSNFKFYMATPKRAVYRKLLTYA